MLWICGPKFHPKDSLGKGKGEQKDKNLGLHLKIGFLWPDAQKIKCQKITKILFTPDNIKSLTRASENHWWHLVHHLNVFLWHIYFDIFGKETKNKNIADTWWHDKENIIVRISDITLNKIVLWRVFSKKQE